MTNIKIIYFISLSTHEGNSKTILEAIAAGCIVIASDIPNNREFIVDNINGFLFDLEKNNLLLALINVLKDKDKLKKISNNAIKTVLENYTIENFIEKRIRNI